ncbi:hypothetical protein COLO4_36718 [Corchorus olitorius]|uniref:PGG domain-containing protein n=1 Tax=Corchorus olitorius TaxID=93759 RepID=A0A1R3G5Y6_9ROSI|nr:hypothetical protein COLO4_36718 [Corchorus olitorius]
MKSLHEMDARNFGRQTVLEALQYNTDLDRRALVKVLSKRQNSENNGNKGLIGLLTLDMGFKDRVGVHVRRHRMRLSDNTVNALLVVAGLILAAIFPYLNSPPGGFRAVILVSHLAERAGLSIFLTFLTDMLISLVIFVICLLLPDCLFVLYKEDHQWRATVGAAAAAYEEQFPLPRESSVHNPLVLGQWSNFSCHPGMAAEQKDITCDRPKNFKPFSMKVPSNKLEEKRKGVCHKDAFYWVAELPNLKDEQGKTVLGLLHEINAKSSKRKTVVEVVQRQTKLDRRIVVKMLSKRHRITENSGSNEELIIGLLKSEMRFNERFAVLVRRHKERLSPNAVNALLVVAGLILAAIFPFLYNPPGAFLSVHNNKSADVSLNYNVTVNSTLHVNVTSNPHTNSTGAEGTGVAIIEGTLISITLIIDTFFLTALSIISLLLPEGLFGGILFTALIGFAYFYFACTLVLATNVGDAVAKIIYVLVFWIYGICALILYRIGIRTVTKLEDLKYRLMKNRYSYLASQDRSTIAAAPASGGGDEGMEAAAQTTPSASS